MRRRPRPRRRTQRNQSFYGYAQNQLWAFSPNVAADALPKDKVQFVAKAKALNLALPAWTERSGSDEEAADGLRDEEEEKGADGGGCATRTKWSSYRR